MRLLLLITFLASCATPEKYTGEYWICNALSENEEPKSHLREGHWGTCEGTEWCAREEALKKCLWKHPKDCQVVSCLKVPGEEKPPTLPVKEDELKF